MGLHDISFGGYIDSLICDVLYNASHIKLSIHPPMRHKLKGHHHAAGPSLKRMEYALMVWQFTIPDLMSTVSIVPTTQAALKGEEKVWSKAVRLQSLTWTTQTIIIMTRKGGLLL